MNAQGELVKLRAMEPPEAEALWRWNHDPEVMRWMGAGYPQSRARVLKWMEERAPNDYGDVLFGIEVLGDAKLIGLVRLHGAEPEVGVVTENEAAQHIYQKVGFVVEGRLRQVFRRDTEWLDSFTMGLLADDLR